MDKGEKFLEKEGIEDILMDFDKEGELICCSHLIDKALNEQLTINSVSQQSELLNALADNFNESTHTYVDQPMIEKTLKAFNCG